MTMQTTCPYCGVGCGVIAPLVAGGDVAGDKTHPANAGRLCSKGAALGRTLGDEGRLLEPTIGGSPVGWDAALDHIAARFAATIAEHGPDSVAFYVSGQFLTEDYYVSNKLMKGFIGSGNIDTNSRLCMASAVAGHVRAFGEDVVPGVYEDLEQADLVVLVGSNFAWCHPVLFQRLQAARKTRGTRVVVIDPRRSATAETADLHLQIAAGTDVTLFNGLLAHLADSGAVDAAWTAQHVAGLDDALAAARADAPDLDAVAATCGIDPEALELLFGWFAATDRSMTVFSQGVNQAENGTDRVNAIINCHLATGRIGRPGMGPFSITGQPNAMGGREVGGLANQLAAHLRPQSPADRALLADFWRAPNLAPNPGLKAVELFDAVADGRVRAIWIAATNPAISMPDAGAVRAALQACPFVVVADCWATDTTDLAHVVLPAAGWGEKDGTVTNSERCISRQRRFRDPPGLARPDWWMFAELGKRLGHAESFAWDGPAAVFREHAALSAHGNTHGTGGGRVFDIGGLATLDDAAYDTLPPLLWPIPLGTQRSAGRLFADGGFPTPDGRACMVPVREHHPAPDAAWPWHLNTGRIRDQWHSMTRTGRVPELAAHTPEPLMSLHPADAATLGIAAGVLVQLQSPHGTAMLRATLDHGQRRGELFAPMHWTRRFASHGAIGATIAPRHDPISGQPALKAAGIRLTPATPHWHGLLLRRGDSVTPAPDLADPIHWVRIPQRAGQMFRLIGLAPLPQAAALETLVAALLRQPGAELLTLTDPSRETHRIAALRSGALAAILLLAPTRDALPAEAVFAAQLNEPVPTHARAALLAGRGTAGTPRGPSICACFGVTEAAIRHAIITRDLSDTGQIGAALKAGTNCGSCLPELAKILRDVRVPAQ